MLQIEHDLKTVNLTGYALRIPRGAVMRCELEKEAAYQISAALYEQFDWQLDACDAAYDPDTRGIHVTVRNGRAMGRTDLIIKREVTVI